MTAKNRSLGIITRCHGSHFMEKGYYKKLTQFGRRAGIRVFVFSPRDVDFETRTVIGFEYRNGAWRRGTFPLPSYIYDRCFISASYRHYKPYIEQLQNDPGITFLGHGLSGKWQVHQILSKSPVLARWLPDTQILSYRNLHATIKKTGAAIIKPMAGTHGVNVVRIVKAGNKYVITGRNRENKPFQRELKTTEGLHRFIAHFTAGRKFLVQPYLSLHTPDGVPYDVRILVQKNGHGEWQTTGMAVRVGDKKSITSNLHGGGKAVPLSTFLSSQFRPEVNAQIEEQLQQLVLELPPFLEEYHGRLVELGIDVGIDTAGNVWIIEVNSRPGRAVFAQINDPKARLNAVSQPLRYAHYLMNERVGGY
ncbi:YheC/YheD family protein [Brevibacillus sp. H7]|jgi:glutathione synthase/RimK-type ligase-like ATP-grasp enzyme|uniref:YheC/YheD family endospore coat-associated protein n=1 Tax=Brevibacillus sp. H7 TaxID=3349138 RepID=UPI0037F3849F